MVIYFLKLKMRFIGFWKKHPVNSLKKYMISKYD